MRKSEAIVTVCMCRKGLEEREREMSLRSGFIMPFFFLGGGFVCLQCLVGGVFFASAPTV
jgi:hypothetical protein